MQFTKRPTKEKQIMTSVWGFFALSFGIGLYAYSFLKQNGEITEVALPLIYGFLFIIIGQFLFPRYFSVKSKRIEWILVVIIILAFPLYRFISHIQPALEKAAYSVCQGGKLPEAATYPSASIHPITIIDDKGKSIDKSSYPKGWRPSKVKQLQLIACTHNYWAIIEKCSYFGGASLTREQNIMEIKLKSARSGETIENISIKGDLPSDCPSEIIQSSVPQRDLGAMVSNEELMDRLEPYVIP